ncbi:MAG: hypothetical protein HQL06_09340 [Nitrospirae bacterium]|nr:hypothetical protein [Nitrospirota bacterium]
MNAQGFACEYFDRISIAGSTMDLDHGAPQVKDFLLKQVRAAKQLHDINHVVLFHHNDCGAYKMACNHSSLEEEKSCQLSDMQEAEEIVNKNLPDLDTAKVWIAINKNNNFPEKFEIV